MAASTSRETRPTWLPIGERCQHPVDESSAVARKAKAVHHFGPPLRKCFRYGFAWPRRSTLAFPTLQLSSSIRITS